MIQITTENYERYKRIFGQLGYNLTKLATQMGATKSIILTQDERWKGKGELGKFAEITSFVNELNAMLNEANVYFAELGFENFCIDTLRLPLELKNNNANSPPNSGELKQFIPRKYHKQLGLNNANGTE